MLACVFIILCKNEGFFWLEQILKAFFLKIAFLKHYLCDVFEIVQNQLKKALKAENKPYLLLACSGGIDSMVLLHLLAKSDYSFGVAHCNFQLRKKESDADATFIAQFCAQQQLPYFEKSFSTKQYAASNGISTQMAARELRYTWFASLKETTGFTHLLTAHHLDDQIETFLINLGRGSGIKGLSGIPDQHILRPLLGVTKAAILAYAKEYNLSWREDASNATEDYLRNKLRHQLVPKWKSIQPEIAQQLEKSMQQLRWAEVALAQQCTEFKAAHFISQDNAIAISIAALRSLIPLEYYLHALFSPYGFNHFKDLEALLAAQSGKQLWSSSHRLLKNRDQILLSPLAENTANSEVEWTPSAALLHPIHLKITDAMVDNQKTARLIREKLKYPLILRKFKEGDYFYPVGMKGKKKLSKFFKDQKYSLLEKEQQWLLLSEGEIVWVIGQRIDARFAATSTTPNPLKITCT